MGIKVDGGGKGYRYTAVYKCPRPLVPRPVETPGNKTEGGHNNESESYIRHQLLPLRFPFSTNGFRKSINKERVLKCTVFTNTTKLSLYNKVSKEWRLCLIGKIEQSKCLIPLVIKSKGN